MELSDLLLDAIGLSGVAIERTQPDKPNLKLEIWVRQIREHCVCGRCGGPLANIKDYRPLTLRAPPIGAYREVIVHLKRLRAVCMTCSGAPELAAVNGLHPKLPNLTVAFGEVAGQLMEELTCEGTARYFRLNSKSLWTLDQWRMRLMRKYLKIPDDLNFSHMSADEVHYRTVSNEQRENPFSERWTTEYLTNLVCSKASKVISNAPGRDARALSVCLKVLPKETREKIAFFALDMNAGYFKAVRKFCPNAEIAVDRFHLAQELNEAFNDVRKLEFKLAKQRNDDFQVGMLEGGRRFILMERNPSLSTEEQNLLGKLKMLNTNINVGMLIVDYFHKVLDKTTIPKFRRALAQWYRLVRESRLKRFRKFAMQIRKYRLNIEAYIKSNLTTAISEGLNNKIKVLKRMGYGYSNIESFQLKILQRCGFLNSQFIDTASWHWHVPHPQ
jgi:transposase